MAGFSLEQVAFFNLRRSGLVDRRFRSAEEAASCHLGVHAQLLGSAAMALAARLPGYDRHAFERDLYERRVLVRVWCMRGTLHLLASADLPLFVRAVMERRAEEGFAWLATQGFDTETVRGLHGRMLEALRGRELRRAELHTIVPELEKIPHPEWGQDVKDLSYLGRIVHSRPQGQEIAFARVEDWLGGYEECALSREEALARIARSYLAAYGPTSAADFAYFLGLDRVGPARAALEGAPGGVVEVSVEGHRSCLYLRAEDLTDLEESAPDPRHVALLPMFDPLLMAYKDRERFIAPGRRRRLLLPGGFVAGTLFVGGRISGVWRHKKVGGRLRAALSLFEPQPAEVLTHAEACLRRLAPALDAAEVTLDVRVG